MEEGRTLPAVQRAYLYIVALVAIHMVVLAVANLLRVGAEITMNAPSGGFTGLPFVFNDFNRARDLYREQASLAIALLAVGGPAWWLSFRAADRAAHRDVAARASAIRSFYLHLVIFVTALLVFGYGQRTLTLFLQWTFVGALPGILLEPAWSARAAGAAAMVLSAAGALLYHVRVSLADRRATLIGRRAAEVRHLALYGLAVIGLLFAAFSTGFTLQGLWDRVIADAIAPQSGPTFGSPGGPTRDENLVAQLIGQIPPILSGVALWLGTWLPLQRGLRQPTADGGVERRSVIRKLAIYFIVGLSAIVVLVSTTFGAAAVIQRLLGDPYQDQTTSLVRDLGFPISFTIIFAPLWLFHRRAVEAEAARESELARAAAIRRSYTYVVAAFGLAMTAIGTAGTVGVLGSQLLGMNTHPKGETATYLALVLVGLPAWGFHWWQAQRRLDEAERRAPQRRAYLYLAVLGGAIGLLVFGSAALYRLLNAALAADFPLSTWHDIWHFTVDAAVAGTVFAFHLRVIRADRGVTAATPVAEAAPAVFTYVVRVPAPNAPAARARLAAALPEAQVTPADAASGEGDGGPSIAAIAGTVIGALLLVFLVASFALPFFFSPQSAPPPPRIAMATKPIWVANFGEPSTFTTTGGASVDTRAGYLVLTFKEAGRATITFPEFTPPFMAVALIGDPPESDGTLIWRLRTAGDRSIAVRLNTSTAYIQLVYEERASGMTEVLGHPARVPATNGGPIEVAVLVRTPIYSVFANGQELINVADDRVTATSTPLSLSASGTTGAIVLLELRVHEAP